MASNNGNNKSAEEYRKALELSVYADGLGSIPVDRHDPDKVNSRIQAFFEYCISSETPANVAALASALGIDKSTMYAWRNGETKDLALGVSNSIKRACQIIESATLSAAQAGGINPIAAALVLNNNFGYANNTQQVNIDIRPHQTADQVIEELRYDALECTPPTENE